jgi:hypothetical protein
VRGVRGRDDDEIERLSGEHLLDVVVQVRGGIACLRLRDALGVARRDRHELEPGRRGDERRVEGRATEAVADDADADGILTLPDCHVARILCPFALVEHCHGEVILVVC